MRCRGHERGDRLDELTEGHVLASLSPPHQVGHERVYRHLHQGIADTEQAERGYHYAEAVTEKGKGEVKRRVTARLMTTVLRRPMRFIRGPSGRRRSGTRGIPLMVTGRRLVRQGEVVLDEVGSRADEVYEAHREESEHNRNQLPASLGSWCSYKSYYLIWYTFYVIYRNGVRAAEELDAVIRFGGEYVVIWTSHRR